MKTIKNEPELILYPFLLIVAPIWMGNIYDISFLEIIGIICLCVAILANIYIYAVNFYIGNQMANVFDEMDDSEIKELIKLMNEEDGSEYELPTKPLTSFSDFLVLNKEFRDEFRNVRDFKFYISILMASIILLTLIWFGWTIISILYGIVIIGSLVFLNEYELKIHKYEQENSN